MPNDVRVRDADALEAVLQETLASARARWPQIVVPDEAFIAHLAARVEPTTYAEDSIVTLATDDLYLACGCVLGHVAAIRALEAHYFPLVEGALSRSGFDAATIADVIQEVRASLLVPRGAEPPRLAKYGGKGKLLGWLRVIARRAANAKHVHDRPKEVELDEDSLEKMLPMLELEPELDVARRESRALFTRALAVGFAALPTGDRRLLRESVLHGVGTPELAARYGVDRTTMFRRLKGAEKKLRANVRRFMTGQGALSFTEYESVMRLLSTAPSELSVDDALARTGEQAAAPSEERRSPNEDR